MSFSRAKDRFQGPNSIYNGTDPKLHAENQSPNPKSIPMFTPGAHKSNKTAHSVQKNYGRWQYDDDDEGLPFYMRPTASSAQKSFKERKAVDGGRLKFELGDGADSLGNLPTFGTNTKGAAKMKRGKHGRFSMASSYLEQSKGSGADYVGSTHGSLETKGVTEFGKNKSERFEGTGSYFEESKSHYDGDVMIGHTELEKQSFNTKGSAAFAKGKLDKGEWIKAGSCLQDKDLSECIVNQQYSLGKSDFDQYYENPSAVFKDTSQRFKEEKPEPGAADLGSVRSDFQKSDAQCGVVYKNNHKHGRFSEFGGIHQNLSSSAAKNTKSQGEQFAARLLSETIYEE